MKSLQKPFLLFLVVSLSFIASSCEDDGNASSSKSQKSTGWKGTDDPSTIPENLNNPFDNSTPPTSMDLTNFLPPIGDQGQYGTCVAWASAYNCKTAMEAVKFGLTSTQLADPRYQMSAKYLFTALDNSKKGDNCNGTDFVPAMELMLASGVATKSVVPYQDLGNCAQSSLNSNWNTDAAKHKIKYYRRIDPTILAIKQALAAKMPVVLGAKLDDSFMDWNSETVYQSHTSFNNVGIHSYHAMCIVGYDNTKGPNGAFKVVNSWSPNWGANGFIWVDYNFMVNGFAFGSNQNKPNEKNFYVAVNDDQKPNPSDPDPVVNPDGVDMVPWVYDDYQETSSSNTGREMEFDLFNIGKQAANASSKWGYAYLYYNAYDANDYGVVFYDEFDPTAPASSYSVRTSGDYAGLQINVNIPAESSFAANFEDGSPSLFRSYSMPNSLNGEYYLLLVADVTDKFTENDESNNLFYTTDQDPKFFSNGVGSRRNVVDDRFQNLVPQSKMMTEAGKRFRTAVKPHRRNAYTPEEIITFLKKEARSGRLAVKVNQARNVKNGTLRLGSSNYASQH